MKRSLLALLLLAFVTTNAQVGIGTNSPNASAKLDITATNKGLLPPRVALTGTADVSTIASPATALLVYNTATAGTTPNNVIPGYYYLNGTSWVILLNGGSSLSASNVTGKLPVANGGTGAATLTGMVTGNGTSAMTALVGANPGETINWNGSTGVWQITGTSSLALGNGAGQTSQSTETVAVGINAGQSNQSNDAVAIGAGAGQYLQGGFSIAIGNNAGQSSQAVNSIAIGVSAGQNNQDVNSVAIGNNAGNNNQGNSSVAIGNNAGNNSQGSNSIAIGNNAGATNQAANSIILNANGSALDAGNSGFFVNPIRSASGSNILTYNNTTSEITYDGGKTFVINHPTKPDRYLVHACLEGPEAGVYYRGEAKVENNQSVTVKLPDYVSALASNFSIQITPIYSDDTDENIVYSTSRVKDNAFTVHGKNGSFYWLVYAQRGKVKVEPKKSDVEVGGDGPYKYIKSRK